MVVKLLNNIISDPDVCNGRPVIKGSRVTVQAIMDMVMSGECESEILKSFPRISANDIDSCKAFTSQLLERPITIKPLRAAG